MLAEFELGRCDEGVTRRRVELAGEVEQAPRSVDVVGAEPETATTVEVQGSGFLGPLTVTFGSETPTPYDVSLTSFKVDVGPQVGAGVVTVSVTNGCGDTGNDASFEFAPVRKRVFVTSTVSDGNLGGIAGADATCNALATAAGLPGSFFAWLGDATTAPASRFTQAPVPYELVDGTAVAVSWADLVDGSLANHVSLDENGASAFGLQTWTGVLADGTALSPGFPTVASCNGWTSSSAAHFGGYGNTSATNGFWTHFASSPTTSCDVARRHYCFQQ